MVTVDITNHIIQENDQLFPYLTIDDVFCPATIIYYFKSC